MARRNRAKPIFYTVMRPMLALLIGEAVLLLLVLLGSNVIGKLSRNSENAVNNHVQNRAAYMGETFASWADLNRLVEELNTATQRALDAGELTLEELDSDPEACTPVILEVINDVITTLYAKRINGLFLVFNTEDLTNVSDTVPISPKGGICIRDLDPMSPHAEENAGLLWERAPEAVVEAMGIPKDDNWQSSFVFTENRPYEERAFFLEPLRAASQGSEGEDAADWGYWSPTRMWDEDSKVRHGTTYSMPLVLEDGTVYGVVGINVLDAYMDLLLLNEELLEDGEGTYLLAVEEQEANNLEQVTPILLRGEGDFAREQTFRLEKNQGHYTYVSPEGERYYLMAEEIPLYGEESLFSGEHWLLLGAVTTSRLYAFSNQMRLLMAAVVLAMLVCGVVASYVASRMMSNPIRALSREIQQVGDQETIPALPPTGILEIDQFSDAITTLSRNVLDASSRFLQIIRLASAELGGFEIRFNEDSIFVTDNFFPMLGMLPIPPEELTVELFQELMQALGEEVPTERRNDQSTVYTVAVTGGTQRYIRVKVIDLDDRRVGVAEDITAAILERMRVERERDYDLLTGLFNRRAFYTQAEKLFEHPEQLQHTALLMMDLDNLKYINDNYGHAWGDKYLKQAGQFFADNNPDSALCARVSGDEFYLLLYGFSSQEALRERLHAFFDAMHASNLVLPSGKRITLSASGGVAWYPEDSESFQELMRYADFAMYQVKRSDKGSLAEFDREKFDAEGRVFQAHAQFRQMIEEQRVRFLFQPIVDAHTGEAVAYEALMRTDFSMLPGPGDVLRVARELNMLRDVECLTMLNAPAVYKELLQQGEIDPHALLFVNSLANQSMTPDAQEQYLQMVDDIQGRIVVELTESEELTEDILREKLRYSGRETPFALDDYGTGYSSERNLLLLAPEYVKVDMAIIRGIDKSRDQRHIVKSLVSYAHNRKMQVVAEGIETLPELYTVLELGVDLLQGFLLARPEAVPSQPPEEIKRTIREFWEQRENQT